MAKLKFGDKVRDKVSGFTGTLTGRSTFMHGKEELLIDPVCNSQSVKAEPAWFAASRVEKLTERRGYVPA